MCHACHVVIFISKKEQRGLGLQNRSNCVDALILISLFYNTLWLFLSDGYQSSTFCTFCTGEEI